jgi:hypothetical protein
MGRKQRGTNGDRTDAGSSSNPALEASGPGEPVRAPAATRELGATAPEVVAVSTPPEAAGKAPVSKDATVPLSIAVEVVRGDIVSQEVPVVVVGQYHGMPPHGPSRRIDKALNSWIKWAIELGMVGCRLGELFYIPVTRGEIKAGGVLLAGMGELQQFGRDDLRFLMTNVVLAVVSLRRDRFGTVLIGSTRDDLPIDRAVRLLLEGTADAFERIPDGGPRRITIVLVEADPKRFALIVSAFKDLKDLGATIEGASLSSVTTREDPITQGADKDDEPTRPDLSPDSPTNQITVTDASTPATATSLLVQRFQYSAMSETATIPVRDVPVQPYFVDRLPGRLMVAETAADQESYGRLLASYLLPDDFYRLLDSNRPLTLVVDPVTARFPWEMAAIRGHRGTIFLGPDLQLTRRFRTSLSAAPGLAPPRNNALRVLIIADPAPPRFDLNGARAEGLAVVKVLALAKAAWGAQLDLHVTVRIGPMAGPEHYDVLQAVRAIPGASEVVGDDAKPCDPLEILALLLNEQFDVVHYAGHGVYDPGGRGKGWLFDDGCVLSAKEIFKLRLVPRLVFANACHSSELDTAPTPAGIAAEQVSLAEAFFERGIDNYIGAGWPVDDAQAVTFATQFYLQALGIRIRPERIELQGAAPPDTLGMALALARKALIQQSPPGKTWGAYQHYGLVNDKLLSFVNDDAVAANAARAAPAAPTTA